MKLICKTLFLTLTTGLIHTNLSANAEAPWTYTTGGKLFSKTTECVKEGKQIIRASGFKVNEVAYDDDPVNGASIFGIHNSKEASITFRCETAFGVYSYATSSPNNNTAYELYKKIIENDPSQI
tara:strand:+ start:629 stop:1000 length:372 start_codon:yes stop_codon:yes gene_type:complete